MKKKLSKENKSELIIIIVAIFFMIMFTIAGRVKYNAESNLDIKNSKYYDFRMDELVKKNKFLTYEEKNLYFKAINENERINLKNKKIIDIINEEREKNII